MEIDKLSKQYYMKQPEFWSDKHNKEMEELAHKLIVKRDILTIIASNDSDFFQHIDGTLEGPKKRGMFDFLKKGADMFANDMNEEYKYILKEIKKASDKARLNLNV